jgi:death-on-curing protein
MNEQIDLAEFLLVAERVLGIDVKALKSTAKLDSAVSTRRALHGLRRHAVLSRPSTAGSDRLLSDHPNHPLPDGNKRTGYLCMLIQLDRAGLAFEHPGGGQDETADVVEALAAGELSEEKFVDWVAIRTH